MSGFEMSLRGGGAGPCVDLAMAGQLASKSTAHGGALPQKEISSPLSGATLWGDLAQLFRNIAARHRQRQLIVALSRRNSRLLEDMGFDPEAIRRAVENSWDEYRPELIWRGEAWSPRTRD